MASMTVVVSSALKWHLFRSFSPAWTARPPGPHRRAAGAYPASSGSGGPEILEAKSQGFVSETRPRSARRTYDQRLRLHGDRSGRERGAAAGVCGEDTAHRERG